MNLFKMLKKSKGSYDDQEEVIKELNKSSVKAPKSYDRFGSTVNKISGIAESLVMIFILGILFIAVYSGTNIVPQFRTIGLCILGLFIVIEILLMIIGLFKRR